MVWLKNQVAKDPPKNSNSNSKCLIIRFDSMRFEAINSEAKNLEGRLHWPTAPVSKDRLQRLSSSNLCVYVNIILYVLYCHCLSSSSYYIYIYVIHRFQPNLHQILAKALCCRISPQEHHVSPATLICRTQGDSGGSRFNWMAKVSNLYSY